MFERSFCFLNCISIWPRDCVSSLGWAAAAETVDDAGADVVEAAAGEADTADAGDDEEQNNQSCYQPDPPDQPTLSVKVYNDAVLRV